MNQGALIFILVFIVFFCFTFFLYTCARLSRSRSTSYGGVPWSTLGIATSAQPHSTTHIFDISPPPPTISRHSKMYGPNSVLRVAHRRSDGSWIFAGPLDPSLLSPFSDICFKPETRYHRSKSAESLTGGSPNWYLYDEAIRSPPPSYSQVEHSHFSNNVKIT